MQSVLSFWTLERRGEPGREALTCRSEVFEPRGKLSPWQAVPKHCLAGGYTGG